MKTAPRGFPRDHPLLDDLRRKDFIAVRPLLRTEVLGPDFIHRVAGAFRKTPPFLRFLCDAVRLPC